MKKIIMIFLVFSVILTGNTAVFADNSNIVICIDPGHQLHQNKGTEPIGPGSTIMKQKVSSGTEGVSTKKPEYVLNLEISKIIKTKLEQKGYKVVMTRETHDVNLSNKERADIANNAKADLFLRIHADGDASEKTNGISVLYPSINNPYTKAIYSESKKAAEVVLSSLIQKTQANSRGAISREDLTGFNWSKEPTILIEAGFMSNIVEDKKMSEKDYQDKIANGIVDGIDKYFNKNSDNKTPVKDIPKSTNDKASSTVEPTIAPTPVESSTSIPTVTKENKDTPSPSIGIENKATNDSIQTNENDVSKTKNKEESKLNSILIYSIIAFFIILSIIILIIRKKSK